jgi:DNA primase
MVCGKELKMGVHISDRRVNCFSCGHKPEPLKFIAELEGLSTRNEVLRLLGSFDDTGYLDIDFSYQRPDEKSIELPDGYKLIGMGNSYTSKLVAQYMKKRGFSISSLQMAGVGYCGTGEYANRIIIPYYSQGELIYFNARRYLDFGSKFKNPSYEELGIGKNTILYNSDALAIYKKVRIVESATNALTIGPTAIGTGGKALSKNQISSIVRSPVEKVSIMLDPDAYDKAIELGLELANYKKVKVVKFPEGKDVNDLGKKTTLELEKATPYKTYKELLKEKWEIKGSLAFI